MSTLLFLANQKDNSQNNTLEDFYHLPAGADTGKNARHFKLKILLELGQTYMCFFSR